jgi:hypothetical protein
MGDLVLVDGEPEIVKWLLENALRTAGRNGTIIGDELRQLAALAAPAAQVVRMRALLAAAGPEVAVAVKAQVTGTAGSAQGAGVAMLARSALSATAAARIAGASSRAVRKACADGRLAARKSRISGEWRIAPAALHGWMEERHVA